MKPLLLFILSTITLCSSSLAAVDNQTDLDNATLTDDDSSQAFVLHISATIDGSERLRFTEGNVRWEHKYWAPASNVKINGVSWNDLSHTPPGWQEIASTLDLTKAHILHRKGRDVIALELTNNGFDLYLCDSPNGAEDYDVTISIPRRE